MIKAILFDFNGVIIDDETIQMKAYEQVLKGHEIALTEELYFGALGMDDRTFVRSMFEHDRSRFGNRPRREDRLAPGDDRRLAAVSGCGDLSQSRGAGV
jgi:beta-phosphoglucomutase-like phosphatase (HAD superfamily)